MSHVKIHELMNLFSYFTREKKKPFWIVSEDMYALILFETENVSIHWSCILKEKAKTIVKNCNACVVVCVADSRDMPTMLHEGWEQVQL